MASIAILNCGTVCLWGHTHIYSQWCNIEIEILDMRNWVWNICYHTWGQPLGEFGDFGSCSGVKILVNKGSATKKSHHFWMIVSVKPFMHRGFPLETFADFGTQFFVSVPDYSWISNCRMRCFKHSCPTMGKLWKCEALLILKYPKNKSWAGYTHGKKAGPTNLPFSRI